MDYAIQQGAHIGGFVLLTQMTGGEFGEAWLCENTVTKRKAVLKGLKKEIFDSANKLIPGFDIIGHAQDEANIMASLSDNNFLFVPKFYDAIKLGDGRVFFLTEFVEGDRLREWLKKEDLSIESRVTFSIKLLHAVNKLHNVGIIHRDLAGDNILVTRNLELKIIDFGIGKIKFELLVKKYSEETVDPFTKLKYTPPKIKQNRKNGFHIESDESWDLYALGILFFEILSGSLTVDPNSEIVTSELIKLPCPDTIRMLIENGRTDNAPGGQEIAVTLNQELRNAGFEKVLLSNGDSASFIESLQTEISCLQKDLVDKRGKTEFSDLAGYLSRMGLAHTVIPKEKAITVEFRNEKGDKVAIKISCENEKIVKINTIDLRKIKKRKQQVLQIINFINWKGEILRAAYDPNDGEIRLFLDIPHANMAIPYEEFEALFGALLKAASDILMAPEDLLLKRDKKEDDKNPSK